MSFILSGLAILLGLAVLYLVFVGFGPGFAVEAEAIEPREPDEPHRPAPPPTFRRDVGFEVAGCRVRGWLYRPETAAPPHPCVVMTHGLGGAKELVLEAYARRYAAAGFATLTFDYRCHGESEGGPRQLVWVPQQLEDLEAAVAFARGCEEIDPERIAIWGTSAGGGYGLTLAARDPRIAAVVSHVPALDPEASYRAFRERAGLGFLLRLLVHGQRDMIRKRLGRPPHYIPLVGRPGTLAVMNTEDAHDFFARYAPPGHPNRVCARFLLRPYRPLADAGRVRCPVLLQLADRDTLAPPVGGEKLAAVLGDRVEVQRFPGGHFEPYVGAQFERAVGEQIEFFRKHLL